MKNFLIAAAALMVATPAVAADYSFDVLYDGATASLAGGSDNPLTTVLNSGDTFTYRLTASGGNGWTTLQNGSIFPFFALYAPNNGFNVDYVLDLNLGAVSVFNEAGNAAGCCSHLGTNSVSFTAGLAWNQYSLTATINSVTNPATPVALLPWPDQAPEDYEPAYIAFGPVSAGAVPEPASWALMIGGFGLAGSALRRRKATLSLRFA